jgi:hypothetical protein
MSDVRCPSCGHVYTICRCSKLDLYSEIERLRKVVDAVERHYDAETTEPGGRESDRTLVEMFRSVDALRELEDSDD